MSFPVSTAAAAEAVYVDDVKCQLGIENHDLDSVVAMHIKTATERIQKLLFCSLITQSRQWKGFSFPCEIPLGYGPVQSVTSIDYTDSNGDSQTLAADQYTLFGDGREWIIKPAWQVSWPQSRWIDQAVVVTYVAGFGDTKSSIPAPITSAIIACVDQLLCDGMMDCTIGQIQGTLEDYVLPSARALRLSTAMGISG